MYVNFINYELFYVDMTCFLEETIELLQLYSLTDAMLYLFLTWNFVEMSVYRISVREIILLFHIEDKYSNLLSIHQSVNLVRRMSLMGR